MQIVGRLFALTFFKNRFHSHGKEKSKEKEEEITSF